ncbi:hypothetical protein DDQ50_00135 [Amnibacterium flavum]|uniref:Uncharacterized protein n=2 Tax=Amnibacterium flavum TaxID=2173173 RepID=A0A2V1HQU9_9MICO|nr:hypothetical protein DDQ50_00135 [Amnibacterium flavum]
MPVGVWIEAESSTSGFAEWKTPIVVGGLTSAKYKFNLDRGGRYAVHVGCGGSAEDWALDLPSDWVDGNKNNFVCNDIHPALSAAAGAVLKKLGKARAALAQGIPYGTCVTR